MDLSIHQSTVPFHSTPLDLVPDFLTNLFLFHFIQIPIQDADYNLTRIFQPASLNTPVRTPPLGILAWLSLRSTPGFAHQGRG